MGDAMNRDMVTEAMREEARRIVAEYYDYEVVENVSLHCIEVEFVLKGMLRAQSPDPATVALQEEVERLREHAGDLTVMYARAVPKDLLVKAAARIEHLQSENERKDAALRTIQSEARRDDVRLVHLRRCVAVQCSAALTKDQQQ